MKYPKAVALKSEKCPDCRDKLEVANLEVIDGLVKAACHNDTCKYTVDLFWLPGQKPGLN
jgi:hypothetical protein